MLSPPLGRRTEPEALKLACMGFEGVLGLGFEVDGLNKRLRNVEACINTPLNPKP